MGDPVMTREAGHEAVERARQILDPGERAALALGLSLHATLILVDDRKAVAVAIQKGFEVTGTLGLLIRAAQDGLLDFPSALERLKATNFHYRQELLTALLAEYKETRKP